MISKAQTLAQRIHVLIVGEFEGLQRSHKRRSWITSVAICSRKNGKDCAFVCFYDVLLADIWNFSGCRRLFRIPGVNEDVNFVSHFACLDRAPSLFCRVVRAWRRTRTKCMRHDNTFLSDNVWICIALKHGGKNWSWFPSRSRICDTLADMFILKPN